MDNNIDNLEFTLYSENEFYDTVDAEDFYDNDTETIYNHLNSKMKLIPFGDYLKRYIFNIAGFSGDFRKIDIKEYQQIIIESFAENYTPKSFKDTTAKLSALAKNWLTQTSVKREVVFLLGFGLNMSAEDVSNFLIYAQRERDFNFKNPFEIICWYCYKHGYKYPKFSQLIDAYDDIPYNKDYINLNATISIRDLFVKIESEDELMQELAKIKSENNGHFFSVTAKSYFDRLYNEAKEIIARKYTEDAQADAEQQAREYLDKADYSDRLSLEEKSIRAEKIRNSYKAFSAKDISESDVEKFLCCGVPFDGQGNLIKFSNSTLAAHFSNKRMNRKHINDIIAGKTGTDRFDLITLNFFIHAMNEEDVNNKSRLLNFINDTDKMLSDCFMGEMYITNPYECFLQMCMLSDCPMGAYSDVLEKSFE